MESVQTPTRQTCSRSTSWASRPIYRFEQGSCITRDDSIIQECAFEVWVNGCFDRALTASPWDLVELAVGELCIDGVISSRSDVIACSYDIKKARIDITCVDARSDDGLKSDRAHNEAIAHRRARTCVSVKDGACVRPSTFSEPQLIYLSPQDVCECVSKLENGSTLFHRTGGVHSAVLLNKDKSIEGWFEDIGRHSALNKLVGWCLLNNIDPSDKIVVFSGRIPYEIVNKLGFLGIPCVISPGAPTSISIDYADCYGLTLIGFAKEGRFNVYSHPERIVNAQ